MGPARPPDRPPTAAQTALASRTGCDPARTCRSGGPGISSETRRTSVTLGQRNWWAFMTTTVGPLTARRQRTSRRRPTDRLCRGPSADEHQGAAGQLDRARDTTPDGRVRGVELDGPGPL